MRLPVALVAAFWRCGEHEAEGGEQGADADDPESDGYSEHQSTPNRSSALMTDTAIIRRPIITKQTVMSLSASMFLIGCPPSSP